MKKIIAAMLFAAVLTIALSASVALSADKPANFPTKNIKIIVSFA